MKAWKNYLKKLRMWKASQKLALMEEELIVDLRKIRAEEGEDVADDLAKAEERVAARKAYIAEIDEKITAAKLQISKRPT